MSVPEFKDLGKSARDVFRTGYHFDKATLKLSGGPRVVGVEADASFDLKTFTCGFLGKYDAEKYGAFRVNYTNNGLAVGEYHLKGLLSESVDVNAGVSINPAESFNSCRLGAKFHNALLHATCSVTKDFDRNVELGSSGVLKLSNLFVGYQASFDTNSSKITKNDVGLAVEHGPASLHFRCIQIPRELGISVFYRVNDKVDVALDAKTASGDEARLWYAGAGLAYQLDEQCKLRMKLDKNCQLATSMQFRAQDNLLLTLGFSLDLGSPRSGQHRVGLGIDVEV
ncbi:voltage-dependent anion-selective channel-like [Phymastichus coffea]|uniref:voltage-dependent anion-selective channel-like n=1 Tax=Phymastichus coffea TaxID=108790 RepID=UPI00273CBE05|nr:voltage-dependent anion-selective channel-like [Phymastichus coffea]